MKTAAELIAEAERLEAEARSALDDATVKAFASGELKDPNYRLTSCPASLALRHRARLLREEAADLDEADELSAGFTPFLPATTAVTAPPVVTATPLGALELHMSEIVNAAMANFHRDQQAAAAIAQASAAAEPAPPAPPKLTAAEQAELVAMRIDAYDDPKAEAEVARRFAAAGLDVEEDLYPEPAAKPNKAEVAAIVARIAAA